MSKDTMAGYVDVDELRAFIAKVDTGIKNLYYDFAKEAAKRYGDYLNQLDFFTAQFQYTNFWGAWNAWYMENYPSDAFWSDEDLWSQVMAYETALMIWSKRFEELTGDKAAPYTKTEPPKNTKGSLINIEGGGGVVTMALVGAGAALALLFALKR